MDKNKKAIYKYIHSDVWKCGITVFIGDCESLRKFARKYFVNSKDIGLLDTIESMCTEENYKSNNVAAREYDSSSGIWIVHMPKFSFSYNPTEITSLSHEIMHATFGVLDYIGVEYRHGGSNEPYTYLHEYFLEEALNKKGYKKV